MHSISENTFGARLLHGQEILTRIKTFSKYTPPQPKQTILEFTAFLGSVENCNAQTSEAEQQYKSIVQARKDAYRYNSTSLIKLLPQIRAAVQAFYGKESQEYNAVSTIISKMTKTKLAQPPAVQTKTGASTKTVSQSQQSYGSLLGYFNDLIHALSQMPGYMPSNVSLQTGNLQFMVDSLNTINSNVTKMTQYLQQQRKTRLGLYTELGVRSQDMKAYVKSEYGVKSHEYESIKGIHA